MYSALDHQKVLEGLCAKLGCFSAASRRWQVYGFFLGTAAVMCLSIRDTSSLSSRARLQLGSYLPASLCILRAQKASWSPILNPEVKILSDSPGIQQFLLHRAIEEALGTGFCLSSDLDLEMCLRKVVVGFHCVELGLLRMEIIL